jgi:arylsulfatase
MKKHMIQSDRAWKLLISLGVLAGSLHAASPLPPKPNILLMVGDDIGWGDIGCYGST